MISSCVSLLAGDLHDAEDNLRSSLKDLYCNDLGHMGLFVFQPFTGVAVQSPGTLCVSFVFPSDEGYGLSGRR